MKQLDEDEVERIAVAAARKAIAEMFITMGVNIHDSEAVLDMQKDFGHLRAWRTSVDAVANKGLMTAVTLLMTGVLAAVWMAISSLKPH